eukprot:3423478-Amphidinium_carterae.2
MPLFFFVLDSRVVGHGVYEQHKESVDCRQSEQAMCEWRCLESMRRRAELSFCLQVVYYIFVAR